MHWKVLAAGAALGFVLALSPGCSGAKKCDATSCSAGCCDTAGNCVKDPNNSLNTQCGTAGATCSDCSALAQTCDKTTYTCKGSTATGGGGGSNTCQGCLLPNGTCTPPQQTSKVNCGKGGEVCKACQTGEECVNGVCETPMAAASVGSPCSIDLDCADIEVSPDEQTLGVTPFCKTHMLNLDVVGGQGFEYPGGYCSKRCGFINNSCGTGAQCLIALGFFGEYENVCRKTCTQHSDCRTGYICAGLSSTLAVCLPATSSDGGLATIDGGPPHTGAAGGPCTADSQCKPPDNGICLEATEVDGGVSGFTDGMCTAQCGAVAGLTLGDAWCGTNGACNAYGVAVNDGKGPLVIWQCEQGCNPDGGGVACRTGYVCNANGACVANCTVPGAGCNAPRTCNATTGLCQ